MFGLAAHTWRRHVYDNKAHISRRCVCVQRAPIYSARGDAYIAAMQCFTVSRFRVRTSPLCSAFETASRFRKRQPVPAPKHSGNAPQESVEMGAPCAPVRVGVGVIGSYSCDGVGDGDLQIGTHLFLVDRGVGVGMEFQLVREHQRTHQREHEHHQDEEDCEISWGGWKAKDFSCCVRYVD